MSEQEIWISNPVPYGERLQGRWFGLPMRLPEIFPPVGPWHYLGAMILGMSFWPLLILAVIVCG